MDTRVFTNFPPEYGESIFDKKGHYIGVDSTKATKEQKQKLVEWKINTERIKKDTSKIIIAFDPTIEYSGEDLKEYLEKHFKSTLKAQKLLFQKKKFTTNIFLILKTSN